MNFRTDEIAVVDERGNLLPGRGAGGEVVVEVRGLPSAEGEEVVLRARATVRVGESDADRRMFREVIAGPRRVIRGGDVAAVWVGRVRDTAMAVGGGGGGLTVEQWLRGDPAVTEGVRRAIATEAYVSGVEVLGEVTVEVEAPAYTARLAEERRRAALAEEAARLEAQRAAEAARRAEEEARLQARRAEEEARWRAAREEEEARRLAAARRTAEAVQAARDAGTGIAELLGRLGPEEGQATLLSAMTSEAASTLVVAIAGTALVRVVPREGRWEHTVQELPGDLGPLRSVGGTQGELLVGARDGVWLIDGDNVRPLRDEQMAAEHGFSALARTVSHVWAAHRQRGLVWWDLASPETPAGSIRPGASGAGPGHRLPPPLPSVGGGEGGRAELGGATILRTEASGGFRSGAAAALPGTFSALLPGRRLGTVVAAGVHLEEIDAAGERRVLGPVPSRCLALAEAEGRVAAVCEDGVIRLYDGPDLQFAGELRLGEMLSGAGLWQWSGGTRLLAASRGGALVAAGVLDPVVLRYASAYRGLLEVAGAGSTLAAVSPDRMRLILWHAGEPRRPASELHVGSIVRGRLADVAVF